MITVASPTTAQSSVQDRITNRAFAQAIQMIHLANTRKDKSPGDPKVGGHPASCASALHILAALHLDVRAPEDFVCCKPHCSPVDHALHHQLGLFRHNETVDWFAGPGRGEAWFTADEAKSAMRGLRAFPNDDMPHVFQSYHAAADPDHFHFLPSGTVGIPPVASGYLALAHRYADDHGWEVPKNAHFWSLMGDSEFREGSLLEAMPDFAERELGNVTWIVDYNRQNLDGTRINNESGLSLHDCDRIEGTAIANGWKVIQVRHGKLREAAFEQPGGAALREVLEQGLSDYELQMLALKRDARQVREFWIARSAACEELVKTLSDDEVLQLLLDAGGHCYETVRAALEASKLESEEPYLLIVHTYKGWGLECFADPANHSALPKKDEVEALLGRADLAVDDAFALFDDDSEEGRFLLARRDLFRDGQDEHRALIERNRAHVRAAIEEAGGLPETLNIDLTMFPLANTQWMWGQLAAKLVRIGSLDSTAERDGDAGKPLDEHEARWAPAAEYFMTMSPDVGSSTNISPAMNQRIYGPEVQDDTLEKRLEVSYKHPELIASEKRWTRHIRFEIAEANAMSAVGAFGTMGRFTGLPFVPVMTVYDFFIKRALDQLYYNAYWGGDFIVLGTPAGVTLSSEGAQHSWKSDIQMPNLITWEPAFAHEVDWILCDAIGRQMASDNAGRSGVLIRGVTRGLQQAALLRYARAQTRSKAVLPSSPLAPAGADWTGAIDESTLAAKPDAELLAGVRSGCLAGAWKLIDWEGYAGYTPGDNVLNLFAMGAPVTEAVEAAEALLARGIYANVIVVSSPELLLGILGEKDDYRHLREGLGINGDLHLSVGDPALVGLAGRRVPAVAVCDGEAGLLDNIGSIVGVKQRTLAVRKFSKCGIVSDVYRYQHLDAASIVEACGQVLAETALENLNVPQGTLERLAGQQPPLGDWRELWPDPPA